MVYTNIQELRGLDQPVDYGSGIEYADGLSYVNGLQVGLWLGGSQGCQDLVDGKLDNNLKRLYEYIVHSPFDVVFLRVGYEFDNPDFGYTDNPEVFRKAFQIVVHGCHKKLHCREMTVFVWHSWAAGLPSGQSLHDYFPGDQYVDWVGISLFQQFYPDSELGNEATVQEVLEFAAATGSNAAADNDDNKNNNSSLGNSKHRHKHKHGYTIDDHHRKNSIPVMIAESTPFRGIDVLDDPWNDWFVPILNLIETHDIALWSYINCDWESQPLWHNVGFGNTRLAENRTILKLWFENVYSNPRFLPNKDVQFAPSSSMCHWHVHPSKHMRPAPSSNSSSFLLSRTIGGFEVWGQHEDEHDLSIRRSLAFWYVLPLFVILAGFTVHRRCDEWSQHVSEHNRQADRLIVGRQGNHSRRYGSLTSEQED